MPAFLSNTGGASFNNEQGPSSEVGRNYRRTREDYGRAYRMLRRDSRKNPESALKMIELRDKANERGITLGGIRKAEQEQANINQYTSSLERMAQDQEKTAQINRGVGGPNNGAAGGGLGSGAAGGGLTGGRDSGAATVSGSGAAGGSDYGGGWKNSEYGGGWKNSAYGVGGDTKAGPSAAQGGSNSLTQGRSFNRNAQTPQAEDSSPMSGSLTDSALTGSAANNVSGGSQMGGSQMGGSLSGTSSLGKTIAQTPVGRKPPVKNWWELTNSKS